MPSSPVWHPLLAVAEQLRLSSGGQVAVLVAVYEQLRLWLSSWCFLHAIDILWDWLHAFDTMKYRIPEMVWLFSGCNEMKKYLKC